MPVPDYTPVANAITDLQAAVANLVTKATADDNAQTALTAATATATATKADRQTAVGVVDSKLDALVAADQAYKAALGTS